MSKMVLLEFLVPKRQVLVVKEVVRQIVADVAKETTGKGSGSSMPAVRKDGMCKMPERVSQDHKERGRHDEAILVHGEIVMNAMKQEVQRNAYTVVGQIVVKVE